MKAIEIRLTTLRLGETAVEQLDNSRLGLFIGPRMDPVRKFPGLIAERAAHMTGRTTGLFNAWLAEAFVGPVLYALWQIPAVRKLLRAIAQKSYEMGRYDEHSRWQYWADEQNRKAS